jgi:hypothetical protein
MTEQTKMKLSEAIRNGAERVHEEHSTYLASGEDAAMYDDEITKPFCGCAIGTAAVGLHPKLQTWEDWLNNYRDTPENAARSIPDVLYRDILINMPELADQEVVLIEKPRGNHPGREFSGPVLDAIDAAHMAEMPRDEIADQLEAQGL